MALDRKNSDQSYLIGRLVAITEMVCKGAPRVLPALVAVSPKNKLTPWFIEAAKDVRGTAYEADWINSLDKLTGELPIQLTAPEQGRMWMGYYHQRSAFDGDDKVKLHVICKAYSTTPTEVAGKLGITTSALRARLAGNPTVKSLQQVAGAIGCEVTDLM